MTRNESISRLCLRSDGFWLTDRLPTHFVTVGGPADKYTDAELDLLAQYTDAEQDRYRERCGGSKLDWADNFISLDKEIDRNMVRWGRKRRSWIQGNMYSPSLPEAISNFWGDIDWKKKIGAICLLPNGDIVEVTSHIPYEEREARGGDYDCRRLTDDAVVQISGYNHPVVIHDQTIEGLGDRIRMAMQHRLASYSATDDDRNSTMAAMTASNDPADLSQMWSQRCLGWQEREAMKTKMVA